MPLFGESAPTGRYEIARCNAPGLQRRKTVQAPMGLGIFFSALSRGDTPGYLMLPRQGTKRPRPTRLAKPGAI
jgi:hypothetical protein